MYREQKENKIGFFKTAVLIISLYYIVKLSLYIGVILSNVLQ